MLYLGQTDWSLDTLRPAPKSSGFFDQAMGVLDFFTHLRLLLETVFFSNHREVVQWLRAQKPDLVLVHLFSMNVIPVLEEEGLPFVQYFAASPVPLFFEDDLDVLCRYPTKDLPMPVDKLKASFLHRVLNQALCRATAVAMEVGVSQMRPLFAKYDSPPPKRGRLPIVDVDHGLVLGGPPLNYPIALPPGWHPVGLMQKPKQQTAALPEALGQWLDASTRPVLYVSTGTKYAFAPDTVPPFLEAVHELIHGRGLRVLWSLRAPEQEKLRKLGLFDFEEHDADLRLEEWTPQPELLKHPAVKIFLSHCGWGGTSDAIGAGVPILAHPGGAEQHLNAERLVHAGVGILLEPGFGNLVAATIALLDDAAAEGTYARNSREAGEALAGLGGFEKAMSLLEAVAEGRPMSPDPQVIAKMGSGPDADFFLRTPQTAEKWACLGLFAAAAGLVLGAAGLVLLGAWKAIRLLRPAKAPLKKKLA